MTGTSSRAGSETEGETSKRQLGLQAVKRSVAAQLAYAIGCVLLLTACVCVFRDGFGTHRLPIHAVSIVLVTIYSVLWLRPHDIPLGRQLGLLLPSDAMKWMSVFAALGAITGGLRFFVGRYLGRGGLELYEREFTRLLAGSSLAETALRWTLFASGLYLAVFVPGMLFCGVIQNSFERAKLFFAGLIIQALTFGFVHCYMTGAFDLNYGMEAFWGAVIYGLAYHYLRSLHPGTLFMCVNVLTVTLLCACLPKG
jgi:membrane protease YdiL (CAAX protease family)